MTSAVTDVCEWLLRPDCAPRGEVTVEGLRLTYIRPRPFALALDLIFGQGIYDLDLPARPRILDGGSWLGLSLLRFHRRHPGSTLIGYEPDPELFDICQENLRRNDAGDVTLKPVALSTAAGRTTFDRTGSDNGSLVARVRDSTRIEVATVDIREEIGDHVDQLKLNVEGAEAQLVSASADLMDRVQNLTIEYHGFAELPQSLHEILLTLHKAKHRYLISHFDERNRACVPPLRVTEDLRYFLLIASRRLDTLEREL